MTAAVKAQYQNKFSFWAVLIPKTASGAVVTKTGKLPEYLVDSW